MTILTRELALQIERAERDCMVDRMMAIREREGNPEGVEIRRFGHAVAVVTRTMPWAQFNTVKGFGQDELPLLDEMMDFFDSCGSRPQIEITPAQGTPEVLQKLQQNGFVPTGFHTSFYKVNPEIDYVELPQRMQTRTMRADEMLAYARIHCLGFGMDESGVEPIRRNNAVLHGRGGWHFELGLMDKLPAAAGVSWMHGGTVSLTFAATLPEFRCQGLQVALIRRRLQRAAMQGCTLAVSQAAYLSTSHRNMERAGMKTAYTRMNLSKQ